jgi:hypothetical protein
LCRNSQHDDSSKTFILTSFTLDIWTSYLIQEIKIISIERYERAHHDEYLTFNKIQKLMPMHCFYTTKVLDAWTTTKPGFILVQVTDYHCFLSFTCNVSLLLYKYPYILFHLKLLDTPNRDNRVGVLHYKHPVLVVKNLCWICGCRQTCDSIIFCSFLEDWIGLDAAVRKR